MVCLFVSQVEDEVIRLSKLKTTKIKEVILRKKLELEEISRKMRMAPQVLKSENFSVEAIESGMPRLEKAYFFSAENSITIMVVNKHQGS